MDTTLEEYIASNVELQETLNCVKEQIRQSKMGKNFLNDSADFAVKSTPNSEEEGDDVMQICVDDEERELWTGPSSQKAFLSLNAKQNDDDEEEFEEMYAKLNSNFKLVEKNEQTNNEAEKTSDEFDLRQIINKKRFDAINIPSVTSQQWRLMEPNVSGNRPAGMPPLVPATLLDEFDDTNNRKMNKRWQYKKKLFTKKYNKNYRNKPFNRELPKVWDVPNGNAGIPNAGASWNSNANAQLPHASVSNENVSLQNVALFVDGFGGLQCLPLGAALNVVAPTYLNASAAGCTLLNSIPNPGYNTNLLQGSLHSAGSYNMSNENGKTNLPFKRSNLHDIRRGGRVERLHNDGSQNNHNVQSAMKLFLNSTANRDDGANMDTNETSLNSTNQTSTLATLVQNMLQQGVTIKLVKPDGEN